MAYKKRILVVHNSYQQEGGEDRVVDAEITLLRSHAHDVAEYRRNNNEINGMAKASLASNTLWSQQSVKQIGELIDTFHPDVIHVHNTFPLISPSAFWIAAERKIPVIHTLHNFRLVCPQAMLLRDGKICEDCLGKLPWRAVTNKCYHDSVLESAMTLSMLATHQAIGTYRRHVTSFIALSNFSRDKFVMGGMPKDRIHVKPNFVVPKHAPAWDGRRGGIFVGRLSPEKGLHVLIDAVMNLLPEFDSQHFIRVLGQGPMDEVVKETFQHHYLGHQSPDQVLQRLQDSLFLVAPSTCYETFGLAAVEAFSCGVPVIASRHGGLGELVKDGVTGLLVRPGDACDLARKIAWAYTHPDEMVQMGRAAYAEYIEKYTPEKNYQMLDAIYTEAIQTAHGELHYA
jgi:glycosyltransferase involved in cell wall biosynthesis